jgi:hypothetical protein
MATEHETSPPDLPLHSGQQSDSIREALAFARQTAKDEIEAIDRLHKRTLISLGIIAGALSLILSLIGWVGYTNLKRIAVQTATDVVQKRLEDELTQKNIDKAVQTALKEHANAQIDAEVRNQVQFHISQQLAELAPQIKQQTAKFTSDAVAKLHPQIEATAKQEAQTLLHTLYAPRSLTQQQVEALVKTARRLGAPARLISVGVGTEPESRQFASQIAMALNSAGWIADARAIVTVSGLDSPYGIYILTRDPDHPEENALKLEQCLRAAGQTVKFGKSPGPIPPLVDTSSLLIQPKQF